MIIKVTIHVDIDTENTDIEDLRDEIIREIVQTADPDQFTLDPVEP